MSQNVAGIIYQELTTQVLLMANQKLVFISFVTGFILLQIEIHSGTINNISPRKGSGPFAR